jgi:hypothetical protein
VVIDVEKGLVEPEDFEFGIIKFEVVEGTFGSESDEVGAVGLEARE